MLKMTLKEVIARINDDKSDFYDLGKPANVKHEGVFGGLKVRLISWVLWLFPAVFFKNIFSLFIIQYKRAQLGRYASLVYFGSTKLKYFNTKRSEMRNCCNIVHFYIHFDMLIPRFYLLL